MGYVYANNNLVGYRKSRKWFWYSSWNYDAYNMILDVYHDIDGFETFDVYQIDQQYHRIV